MPIYMDRHDLDDNIDAEHVARIHQADLKFEDEFGCKGLTYWYDGQKKTAFCLIKAPNKEALSAMHDKAHGGIPNSIIEVNPGIVESFLGRIVDPVSDTKVIDDPAFRIIMMLEVSPKSLNGMNGATQNDGLSDFHGFIIDQISNFNGRLVKNTPRSNLVSFRSVSDAIDCTTSIYSNYESLTAIKNAHSLHIGISCGLPVAEGKGFFEGTIADAKRMCKEVQGGIVLSSNVLELCSNSILNEKIKLHYFRYLKPQEEKFLSSLMEFTEKKWNKTNLKVDHFSAALGLSKSQLYRKVKFLTGKSLNIFLKSYRLEKAIKMIENHSGNISEIAFDSGFNSAAYFSKCFADTYGILPSDYSKNRLAS
ncbi:nickel-binding protein [Lutimonas sp.]|uniref:nickel-binding protein n=1 Tax=Lutimonas sp. TaxID=1872403 RepID=UPI003D9B6BCF